MQASKGRESPAVQTGYCPNCGRKTAVVFPLVPAGIKVENAKIVCLVCCPTKSEDIENALSETKCDETKV